MQLENFTPQQFADPFEYELQHSEKFSPYAALSPCNKTSQTCIKRPTKKLKTIRKTSAMEHSSCSIALERSCVDKEAEEANARSSVPNTKLGCPLEHAITERKRREKLSQQFIALSGMVPGLKKVDKSSILESSIKYLKNLEERVKILEEKTSKRTVESAVFVNKLQIPSDNYSSTQETSSDFCYLALPQIETKVLDRNVLIRIHCENHKGILAKILSEVQKLKQTVCNYSVMSLGGSTFDVTILTETDEEFNITAKDLLMRLRSSLVRSP
ncbi:hypothetical protein ACHQM5_018699 [Ranunculus cassubicifolius]